MTFPAKIHCGGNFVAESFNSAELLLMHPDHWIVAVSFLFHYAIKNKSTKLWYWKTHSASNIWRENRTAFQHHLFAAALTVSVLIEYKQPMCNEPGYDSPALQFVGFQLWLPTASEMCLMCCDAWRCHNSGAGSKPGLQLSPCMPNRTQRIVVCQQASIYQ